MITTKWPRLLVLGEPVESVDAWEIIMRTTDWSWLPHATNDRAWRTLVEGLLGTYAQIPRVPDYSEPAHGAYFAYREWARRRGVLDLHYLHNARVASNWICGPHGWIDWDGQVEASTWNVGKWPKDEDIRFDLDRIAAAFPRLRMRVQVVEDEGAGRPAAEWLVERGEVAWYDPEPRRLIATPQDCKIAYLRPGGERGCSVGQLVDALLEWNRVLEARGGYER